MVERLVHKMFGRLKTGLQLVVGRAVLKAVSQQGGRQFAKANLLAGETHDGLEMFQQYGFYSWPLSDCEAITLSVGGKRNASVIVATADKRYEPLDKEPGEVGLTHKTGKLFRHRDDQTELTTPKFVVDTGELIISADTVVIDSSDIRLGGPGGEKVARVGDLVEISAGDSAGQWPIISGSEKVTAE